MHGSDGEDCLFYQVRDFQEIMRCEQDRNGKRYAKGHFCSYWHAAAANQGLMAKQEGSILPYPPKAAAHIRQPRGLGAPPQWVSASGGRSVHLIRGRENALSSLWMGSVHEVYYDIGVHSGRLGDKRGTPGEAKRKRKCLWPIVLG